MGRGLLFSALSAIAALVLYHPVASAQSTGTIQGQVSDPSGAAIGNAKVTVRNTSTGEQRTTLTADSGFYIVPSLTIGHYDITVNAPGLQTAEAHDLVLQVNSILQQNFRMQLGSVSETVQVEASAAVVESGTITVGSVIDQHTVQEVPLNGRHFVDLGLLTPGTVAPPSGGYLTAPLRGQGSFAVFTAGNREDTTNFMINGINLNDMSQNQITFQPSINTVQEFKMDNSTFSAEYGRSSGAIVNIATRAGTNGFHGELFDYLRNDAVDARNYFNRQGTLQSPFKRNNFGVDGGGPILKNRTFFFLSYEGLRQRQGITLSQQVLTDAQRSAAASIGNPTVAKLLPLIPAPNAGSLFVGSATAPVDIDQGTANLNHNFGSNDRLNGYFAFQRDLRQEPTLQGNNIPGFGDTRASHRQIMTVNETHVFSAQLVNEARLGYNRIKIDFVPNAALNPADFGMNVGVNSPWGLPQMTLRDIGLNLGGPSGFPQGRGDYTAVASDTLSYIRGGHELKFGGEVRRFNGNSYAATPGTLAFNTVTDFINGQAASFTALPTSNPSRLYILAVGAFVQDRYRLSKGLLVELGLRYDWFGTPVEAQDRFSQFDPATASLVRVHQPYQQNAKNFQPRVGLAWDLFHNGRSVLRTAYAILADQPVAGLVGAMTSNPPFATPVTYNSTAAVPFVTFANALTAAQAAGSLSPTTTAADYRTAYVQSYNVNFQQQVTGTLGITVGYYGNKATHLRTALNINQFLPGTNLRPYPRLAADSPILPGAALGNINQWQGIGNSNYNGLWVTATKQLSRNLQFNTSYTWAKSIDYTSYNTQNAVGPTVPIQDSYNLRLDRGLSDFDVRHRFVFSGIYQLPFRGGRAVEGWHLSLIGQVQSGNPFNVITTSTFNGTANTIRPNLLGPVHTGIGSSPTGNPQYFAPAACTAAATTPGCLFQVPTGIGSLGRNVLIGPGLEDVDLALFKDTRISEHTLVQFRVDAFNLFNHPNFATPNRTVSTAPGNSFGQITATRFPVGDWGSSRQLQMALKFIF